MILVIDNYDSFVHNLARYIRQLGCETKIVRNDEISADEILAAERESNLEAILISPGPCAPDQSGCTLDVIEKCHQTIPILGVCLGHQAIAQAFGGNIVSANQPMHGRASQISHSCSPMFEGIPEKFQAGRYHSLVAEKSSLPECLTPTAFSDDFTIMAIEHKSLPIVGLQFHPESILTENGYRLLFNFLKIAKVDGVTNPPPLILTATRPQTKAHSHAHSRSVNS